MPLVQRGVRADRRFTFVDAPGHPVIQRKNRTLGTHAPDGRRYEVCPMCSARANLAEPKRNELGQVLDIWHKCMNCGYEDSDKLGPLN